MSKNKNQIPQNSQLEVKVCVTDVGCLIPNHPVVGEGGYINIKSIIPVFMEIEATCGILHMNSQDREIMGCKFYNYVGNKYDEGGSSPWECNHKLPRRNFVRIEGPLYKMLCFPNDNVPHYLQDAIRFIAGHGGIAEWRSDVSEAVLNEYPKARDYPADSDFQRNLLILFKQTITYKKPELELELKKFNKMIEEKWYESVTQLTREYPQIDRGGNINYPISMRIALELALKGEVIGRKNK